MLACAKRVAANQRDTHFDKNVLTTQARRKKEQVWQAPYLKGHCPFKGCWAQQHTIANAAVKPASPRVLDLKRLRSPPVLVGSQPRPSIVDRFSTR
ncbi:hypothetical protein T01_2442 [Trichinella spiralis]|uniref:Uncharacterized protein n=1 Tax=Trichinella spiralis TaxID=6334 RepID=A0A0V1AUW2_TRISP|nr:hypothetical protein T01_2442 [Trichinella spiralis]